MNKLLREMKIFPPEEYDIMMTLIVGAVTYDYIVINGDGHATSQTNTPTQHENFIKIFPLHDDICFGIAVNGISGFDIYANKRS